jgi:hypothetical protein
MAFKAKAPEQATVKAINPANRVMASPAAGSLANPAKDKRDKANRVRDKPAKVHRVKVRPPMGNLRHLCAAAPPAQQPLF